MNIASVTRCAPAATRRPSREDVRVVGLRDRDRPLHATGGQGYQCRPAPAVGPTRSDRPAPPRRRRRVRQREDHRPLDPRHRPDHRFGEHASCADPDPSTVSRALTATSCPIAARRASPATASALDERRLLRPHRHALDQEAVAIDRVNRRRTRARRGQPSIIARNSSATIPPSRAGPGTGSAARPAAPVTAIAASSVPHDRRHALDVVVERARHRSR